MNNVIGISAQQARNIQLAAQGLLRRPPARPTRAALLAAIERMELLQIDTIHVVARSPYFVLYSRLGAYPSSWLDGLLEAGQVFEAWAHEACFIAARDHALHVAHRELGARSIHWAHRHAMRMHEGQRAGMDALLAHIRDRGAVKASDFDRGSAAPKSGWWDWKDEKRWLEALFALGELMVRRRERFQRVYDLSERVVANMPRAYPAPGDVPRELILRAIRALGVCEARSIADYFRTGRKHKDGDLDALVDAGELQRVAVAGWDAVGYVHRDHAGVLDSARRGRLRATHTTLLSPFDPLVWDRTRARGTFDFDYTLECYTPAPKRRYGYFVLPILDRGRLVGRVDAKAHREDGVFEVRQLHLEAGSVGDEALAPRIAGALLDCAAWHGTPRVVVVTCEPRSFAVTLRKALRACMRPAP